MPHWLLAALFLAMAGGARVIQHGRRRRMERTVAAEVLS
jgi:anthranilate phosphoribosyltransferase